MRASGRFAAAILVYVASTALSLTAMAATPGDASADIFAYPTDAASPHNISGVWWAAGKVRDLHPLDGTAIPLTAAGLAQYQANTAGLADHSLVDRTRHACLPAGVPRIMTTEYPFHIVQTAGQLVMLFEENRSNRIVRLDVAHHDPKVWDPSFMGDAVGSWSADNVLTIETTNFKPVTFLDETGLPHGDKLVVVERIRKLPGSQLEDVATIADPDMYTHPWSVKLVFNSHPDIEIMTDWVCGEPHRNLASAQTGIK